jgi:uncharacterized protein YbbK (DUF523 family)/uncharacterized protein YbgA (DUF1722 family)
MAENWVKMSGMDRKIRVGVSSCLTGEMVRYDGGHKLDPSIRDILGRCLDLVPVCPEVESGMPVPREAMRLEGDPDDPRLVTRKTGVDHTEMMSRWIRKRLPELAREDLCGFIFKSRSPSSGMAGIRVYGSSGRISRRGRGLFAAAFMEKFPMVPVEDDERLHDPARRENFIQRVFTLQRWMDLKAQGPPSRGRLVDFHADHEYLIMAHSPKHLRLLGRLAAGEKGLHPRKLYHEYLRVLMEGLKLQATVRKNVNVLQHMMGCIKKDLTPGEKGDLLEAIGEYHRGRVFLEVPLGIIRRYAVMHDSPYLRRQRYLEPRPGI